MENIDALQESLIVVNSRPNQQTLKAKLKKCVFNRLLTSTESAATLAMCYFVGKDRATPHKDQLSLTNPRDSLHHGERAANK